MPIEINLPNLGDGIDTGDVLELLVKEGDVVAKDQGIIELETGKATLQVPSSAAGKVAKIHVHAGQTIPPGTLLLTLDAAAAEAKGDKSQETGDRGQAPKTAAKAEKAPTTQESGTTTGPDKGAQAPASASKAPPPQPPPKRESAPVQPAPKTSPAPSAHEPPAPSPSPPPPLPESTHDGGVAAGPAVRRFAREVGVDLARVSGSGPGGRITREDVLTVVRQASQT